MCDPRDSRWTGTFEWRKVGIRRSRPRDPEFMPRSGACPDRKTWQIAVVVTTSRPPPIHSIEPSALATVPWR